MARRTGADGVTVPKARHQSPAATGSQMVCAYAQLQTHQHLRLTLTLQTNQGYA
jgi:hypothetical protein